MSHCSPASLCPCCGDIAAMSTSSCMWGAGCCGHRPGQRTCAGTGSQDILSWEGPARITGSNSDVNDPSGDRTRDLGGGSSGRCGAGDRSEVSDCHSVRGCGVRAATQPQPQPHSLMFARPLGEGPVRDGSRRERRDARGHWHSSLAPRHWGHQAAGTIPREATASGRRGRGPAPGSPCVCRIGVPGTGCHSAAQPRACLHRKCLITASFISSAAVGKEDAVPVDFSARQQLGILRWPDPSLIPIFSLGKPH